MSNGPFTSAMRELRQDFSNPRLIVVLIAIGLLIGLSGPFNTFEMIRTAPRLAYWMVIVFATYATGSAVTAIFDTIFRGAAKKSYFAVGAKGVLVGLAVSLVVVGIGYLSFGIMHDTWRGFATQTALVVMIATIVVITFELVSTEATAEATPPPLLARLPYDKRGALMALSVDDHYVNVMTTQGSHMVLMRLGDAMREVGATIGLQIHRSHWVALDQIATATRIADRAEITLHSGTTLPVSRSNVAALKDAGLLPKPANG